MVSPSRPAREALILAACALIAAAIVFAVGPFESLAAWFRRNESWRPADLFLALIILILAGSLILLRSALRWCREIRAHEQVSAERLDKEVRLRMLLETTRAVPWEADAMTWRFTYIGTRAAEILGHPTEAWSDPEFWSSQIHPEDRAYALNYCQEHSRGSADYEFEYRWLTADRRVLWIHDIVHVVSVDGVPERLRGFMIDVTQRKSAEKALEQAQRELERRVESRTAELRETNERLQRTIEEERRAKELLRHYQSRLRSLATQLALGEERERRRLAAELHDRTIQTLGLSRIKIGALRHSRARKERETIVREIQDLVEGAIRDTRSLIFELSPPILYELGFEAAVEWLLERLAEREGIGVEFGDDHEPKPLDDDVRVALFQAVRELLNNVGKHARARAVRVSLRREGGALHVGIRDDGVGFDPRGLAKPGLSTGGYGLFSIRERLGLLGGSLAIESKPNGGTRAELTAPLRLEHVEAALPERSPKTITDPSVRDLPISESGKT